MKKIILLLALFLTFVTFSQTTDDEYNYMIKGYQLQVSSGLDMKKGYQLQDLVVMNRGSYNFDFKALLRSDNTLAGILVVSTSKSWGNTYYVGIPFANEILTSKYETEVAKWDEPMTTAYAFVLSNLYVTVINNYLVNALKEKN